MQNANPDNSVNPQNNNVATANDANVPVNGQNANFVNNASNQLGNVGQSAQAQLDNVSQAAQAQVGNLAQGMQNQVGNLGQAGVEQVGGFMSQFTKPLTDKAGHPPVSKDEKIYGGLSYIPFVSLACIILKPDSAFVRLHVKQGLLLTIIFMFVGMLAAIVSIFGIIGVLLGFLLGLVPLASLVIGIYSMFLAFTGYWWKIPVLSSVADLIPIEMIAKVSKDNISGQIGIAKNDFDNRQQTLTSETQQKTETVNVDPIIQQPPVNNQNIPKS